MDHTVRPRPIQRQVTGVEQLENQDPVDTSALLGYSSLGAGDRRNTWEGPYVSDRINCIIIRTKITSEENKDILYALRNVLHVAEAEFGYVVTFEEPVKRDYVEPFVKACQSFDFVEDVKDVDLGVFEFDHHRASIRIKGLVFDFLNDQMPKVADYGDDLSRFSADVRAWHTVSLAVQGGLRETKSER
jgi:hypothetical protein